MKTIILSTLFLSALASGDPHHYVELSAGNGQVNWSTGQVAAEGYGIAPEGKKGRVAGLLACRAAVVDAQRNLLEVTQGVRVNSTTAISNFMLTSDEVKTSVEGLVKGARLIERNPDPQGNCQVKMALRLSGSASRAIYTEVLDSEIKQEDNLISRLLDFTFFGVAHASESNPSIAPWKEAVDKLAQRLTELEGRFSDDEEVQKTQSLLPTGLVVDARGSNFIPSMNPKIRRLRGAIIYPDREATQATINNGRLVSLFSRNVEFAMNHPVVGARPLVVKALRTWGDTRTEIVLSNDFSDRIVALDESGFFDGQNGVVIVLD